MILSCYITLPPSLDLTALWKTYPPHTNTALLSSIHKAAILDVQFSLIHPHIYTCSADSTLAITDITTGVRQRKYLAHDGVVNSIDRARSGGGGRELVVSGGDDGVVRCWDQDVEGKRAVIELEGTGVPTTAVCWSGDGAQVFVGGIDNEIQVSSPPSLPDASISPTAQRPES